MRVEASRVKGTRGTGDHPIPENRRGRFFKAEEKRKNEPEIISKNR